MAKEKEEVVVLPDVVKQNEELKNEVAKLKQKIGGYVTANANYKKAIEEMKHSLYAAKEEILRCKGNIKEATVECDNCKRQHQEEIVSLNNTIDALKRQVVSVTQQFNQKVNECMCLQERIEKINSLPWYKRIFTL